MGSEPCPKSVLVLCGDYMEDYEVIVPCYVLRAFRVRVDCVSPGKRAGDKCLTAVHDFHGFELYTELPGHLFEINATLDSIQLESYDALIIPGGRFTETLSADDDVVRLVKRFAETGRPIATSCHSQLMLVAAGLLSGGKLCTAFPSLKPVIEMAGGKWWSRNPGSTELDIFACVMDGNLLSTIGWPAYGEYMNFLIRSIGGEITRNGNKSVLFLIGDYVEDHEINVPFRAMESLGCKVDTVSPSKKKGETCVTAIHDHDDDGSQICSEKRGHNFAITANWGEIRADDYDCVVVPGGRSPELLVMNPSALSLVKEFQEKGKVVGAIGQGVWLLAAAGILKGRRCSGSNGLKAMVKAVGGEFNSSECTIDRNLVTAKEWPSLPAFVSELCNLLEVSVIF
ncbi:hypothetical protein MLD38_026442 [Melastoma candidum]|uniref:Uncharacterized protein n=1 Tax=Melastoma candidum TaxID=119954 RepID=A0ACB9NYL3_9MYRT|nr:hypothetical protein MLD38_026442 [Melastoma candidum]